MRNPTIEEGGPQGDDLAIPCLYFCEFCFEEPTKNTLCTKSNIFIHNYTS